MRALALALIVGTFGVAACHDDNQYPNDNTVVVDNDSNTVDRVCFDADQHRVECPEE